MTQREIINQCWGEFKQLGNPREFSDYFNFHQGALLAFKFAYSQFKELLDEHFGDEPQWRDEKEDMLFNFEQRIGIEE